MPIIWKSFFDFDMRLSNSSKNDNELIFKWNKEKELPMSLKVEFRPLIVTYLVVVLSELIPLMKFSVLEIAGFAIWVNLTCFPMTICFNSLSSKMLTWYKLLEAKTASTNFTWLYFKTFDSFIFSNLNLNIYTHFISLVFDGLLQSVCFWMFCSKHSITSENNYLLSCWFHCVDILCIRFRFCETFTVTDVVSRILLTETPSNFKTLKCCFTLYLHMYHVCFRLV